MRVDQKWGLHPSLKALVLQVTTDDRNRKHGYVPGTRQTWCMYVYLLAHNKHWNPSLSADVVQKARTQSTTKQLTDRCHQTKVHVWAVWRTLGITYSVNYLVRTMDRSACGPWSADFSHYPRTLWSRMRIIIHGRRYAHSAHGILPRTSLDRPHVAWFVVRSHQWLTQVNVDS